MLAILLSATLALGGVGVSPNGQTGWKNRGTTCASGALNGAVEGFVLRLSGTITPCAPADADDFFAIARYFWNSAGGIAFTGHFTTYDLDRPDTQFVIPVPARSGALCLVSYYNTKISCLLVEGATVVPIPSTHPLTQLPLTDVTMATGLPRCGTCW